MGKGDVTVEGEAAPEGPSYEEKLRFVSVIAKPMASKKLAKKVYKARIRKGETGLVIFAGDVTPIEVMCHMPAVCEEKGLPYVYTPSRQDLGTAMGVKRGCLMMMVREHEDYKELYDEVEAEIKALPPPILS